MKNRLYSGGSSLTTRCTRGTSCQNLGIKRDGSRGAHTRNKVRDGPDHNHGQGISASEHGQAGPDTGFQNCHGILPMAGLDGTPENVQPRTLPKLRRAGPRHAGTGFYCGPRRRGTRPRNSILMSIIVEIRWWSKSVMDQNDPTQIVDFTFSSPG